MKKMVQVVALLAATLALGSAHAADGQPPAHKAVTVHVDGHLGGGLAKKVNEMHAKMEAEGWRFAGLVAHTENGATEGLWVTYVRD